MGCFAYTCTVSGLPIHAGEDVRVLLVSENPYADETVCYTHGVWIPRTWPIKAKYNDYGSIEDFEEGPFTAAWLEMFKLDLVEKGWGDNSCHDVPVSKDMNFAALLEAISEQRVFVKRDAWQPVNFTGGWVPKPIDRTQFEPRPEWEPKDGIPTIRRIKQVAADAGFTFFGEPAEDHNRTVMIDDEEGMGCIRVRIGGYGDDKKSTLAKVAKAIEKAGYGVLMTPGTGPYSNKVELLVRPLPGVDWFTGRDKDKEPLRVDMAMIREDVWQTIIGIKYKGDSWGEPTDLKPLLTLARQAWDQFTTPVDVPAGTDLEIALLLARNMHLEYGPERFFLKEDVPMTIGLGTSFRTVANMKLTPEQAEEFVTAAGEFAYVYRLLAETRYVWQPSYPAGPRFGNWQLHKKLLKGYLDVVNKVIKKEKEEDY